MFNFLTTAAHPDLLASFIAVFQLLLSYWISLLVRLPATQHQSMAMNREILNPLSHDYASPLQGIILLKREVPVYKL